MDTVKTETTSGLEHTECVAEAAVEIFNATCGVTLEPLAEVENLAGDGVIIAVISLVGDVEWSVFLGLPKDTASAAAAKFAGFEIPFESADMGDAIGELTNMLAGQVKALLDQRGVKADISLPSVMRADNMSILVQRDSAGEKTCFNSPLGKLWTGVIVGHGGSIVA